MKLSVERLALVMPRSSGSATAGCPPSEITRSFSSSKRHLLHLIADQEVGVADLLDPHPAEHLPNDHLDVLVVDAHALQAVDLLHLVH